MGTTNRRSFLAGSAAAVGSAAPLKAIETAAIVARSVSFFGVPPAERLQLYPAFPKAFAAEICDPFAGNPAILFERELFTKLELLNFDKHAETALKDTVEVLNAILNK